MSTPQDDPARLDQQLRNTLLAAPASALPALVAFIVLLRLLPAHLHAALWLWGGAFLGVTALRLIAVWQWCRRPVDAARAQAWYRPWLASSALHAAQWGALGMFAAGLPASPASMVVEALLHIALAAVAMGGALRLQGFDRMLWVHVVLVLTPLGLRDLLVGGTEHLLMGALLALFGFYATVQGRRQSRLMRDMEAQRARTQSLVEALQRECQQSESARHQLEEATLARSRFFAAANHDLRQPLHALGLLAESLQQAESLSRVRQVAGHMSECVDGMAQVVDELLEVTRLDLRQVHAQPMAVALRALVQDAVRPYQALARLKGLSLALNLPDVGVRSDPALLARVIANLVSNGIRFTASGGVTVAAEVEGESLLLSVQDTGIGIEPRHLPHLFEAFFQVGNPERDRRQGLGLGLATVQRLCELLAIELTVASTPGAGSRFSLRLALAPRPAQDAPPLVTAPSDPAPMAGRRILVVDDDHDAQHALRQLLQGWGCVVRAAVDAQQALDALTDGFAADALLVDLRLPGPQSGLDLLQTLRRSGPTPPALLLTGDAGGQGSRAVEAAGWPVLVKPVRPAALRAFLGQAFAGTVPATPPA
ncbi:ATP-binding protein [Inhella sp.]|uniref:hybrid sensor histidine kinase/response regulator n=1 Tax=Inhella sp. TaxID=1921806 RepID=UPI0035B2DE60